MKVLRLFLNMKESFRGCLVGALLGDCLGAPFEICDSNQEKVDAFFNELQSTQARGNLKYTDDTAMTFDIAESLLCHHSFEPGDMAKRFCETYYSSQTVDLNRGYGGNVIDVFAEWKRLLNRSSLNEADPFAAARKQFDGRGSYGNGGAMRISPIPLFALDNRSTMMELAQKSTLLTHTHRDGVNGALLQCLAIYKILDFRKKDEWPKEICPMSFIEELIVDMTSIESSSSIDFSSHPYTTKLKLIKKHLSEKVEPSNKEIVSTLGNYVTAPKSVPTAIYCFLRNLASENKQQNVAIRPFEAMLRHAISLEGDTDTIGSMAGSLAGAYYGFKEIPGHLLQACEGVENALRLADLLYSHYSTRV